MRFCAISDTHNQHNELEIPECDLLIHAGDSTMGGSKDEITQFVMWLDEQKAENIIIVPGNHEIWWEQNWEDGLEIVNAHCPRAHVLNDSGLELNDIKFWGSPVTPFYGNWAWNRARTPGAVLWHGPWIKDHWDKIPTELDVLITHGPPYQILDDVGFPGGHQGCTELLKRLDVVKPHTHIFGHLHEGYGHVSVQDINFYNVSICNSWYNPTNAITLGTFI